MPRDEFEDYYALLKIDPSAAIEEVERAYRHEIRYWHPDNFANRSLTYQKQANNHTAKLNNAYDLLRNPEKRALYDELRAEWLDKVEDLSEEDEQADRQHDPEQERDEQDATFRVNGRNEALAEERVFELMQDVIAELPARYQVALRDVEFVVRDEALPQERLRVASGNDLYGLFEGVPVTQRGHGISLPDRITVFWIPLIRDFPDQSQLAWEVRVTVLEMIARYFGVEELNDIDWEEDEEAEQPPMTVADLRAAMGLFDEELGAQAPANGILDSDRPLSGHASTRGSGLQRNAVYSLKWAAVPPAGILGAAAGWLAVTLIGVFADLTEGLNPLRIDEVLEVLRFGASGYGFVVAGASVAPRLKARTAVALLVVEALALGGFATLLALVVLSPGLTISTSEAVADGIGIGVALAAGVAGVRQIMEEHNE